MADLKPDQVVESVKVFQTVDYSKFKALPGSRPVEATHAKALARKIDTKDLTREFPIEVNEKFGVVDGWHRIKACELLEHPVYYVIKPNLNSDDMIQINTGVRNWTWKNFAYSWADRGNENYKLFTKLYEEFGGRFKILLTYCGKMNVKTASTEGISSGTEFHEGNFVMDDFETTRQLLGQLDDLEHISKVRSSEFAFALYRFMRTPQYDHERMKDHTRKFGANLNTCYSMTDYLFEIEKIYNTHRS